MMDAFSLPEEDDDDVDIYAALGLNTPVASDKGNDAAHVDPLAAFMDDEDEEEAYEPFTVQETVPYDHPSSSVEELLATLARELLDEERLSACLDGGRADLTSLTVQRDRDAYHLSLIVDMGGQQIKPFATVLANDDGWKPLTAPKGLHSRWKPLYDSLCQTLTRALAQQGRPSTL